jgi:hypothetical protein
LLAGKAFIVTSFNIHSHVDIPETAKPGKRKASGDAEVVRPEKKIMTVRVDF